jgi:hypothetical protein
MIVVRSGMKEDVVLQEGLIREGRNLLLCEKPIHQD